MSVRVCHHDDRAIGEPAAHPLDARSPVKPHAIRILVALLASLMLGGCGHDKAGNRGGSTPPATVTSISVQPSPWIDGIDALGTAHASESVTITAKVSETVDHVHFESGDFVQAGQVLVTLTGKSELAGLSAASASYRAAEQLFERQQALAAQKLLAASAIDAQRGVRDAAKANMDQVRASLSDRVITAPFDGVLGLRQVSRGSLITPNTVIATLDDVATIHLDFSVPERDLPMLSKGQIVIASSDAYPGKIFAGSIATLDARVDPVTRAITVRAEIPNPERKLRPGMLLNVVVQQPARQTLQVPELSIQQVGQQASVFRIGAKNKVALVPVKIGARKPGSVEIVDGLHAGDRIVVEGIVKLHDGSAVIEAGATEAAVTESGAQSGTQSATPAPTRN